MNTNEKITRLFELKPLRHNRSKSRCRRMLAGMAAVEHDKIFASLPGNVRRAIDRGNINEKTVLLHKEGRAHTDGHGTMYGDNPKPFRPPEQNLRVLSQLLAVAAVFAPPSLILQQEGVDQ